MSSQDPCAEAEPASVGPDVGQSRVRINRASSYGPLVPAFQAGSVGSCFMLISPNTPYENRHRLEAILAWLSERSRKTVVVDGGYLDRWNLQFLHGMGTEDAEATALRKSKRIGRRVERAITTYGWSGRVAFWDYHQVLSDPRFRETRSWLWNLFPIAEFSSSIDSYIAAYLNRQCHTSSSTSPDTVEALRGYVIEEISLSMTLHGHGLSCECYVGPDFAVIERIAHGDFGIPPVDITQRTFVSLELETS